MGEGKDSKKVNESKKQQSKLTVKSRVFLICSVLMAVIFLPTSMLVILGMLPSIVAFVVSNKGNRTKVSTVTAMNLAGCIPFIFKLWSSGNDFMASFEIISSMYYMVIIYLAAVFGYMIDWVITGIVSSFLYQRGIARMEAIKKRQEELISQWGEEVCS